MADISVHHVTAVTLTHKASTFLPGRYNDFDILEVAIDGKNADILRIFFDSSSCRDRIGRAVAAFNGGWKADGEMEDGNARI